MLLVAQGKWSMENTETSTDLRDECEELSPWG